MGNVSDVRITRRTGFCYGVREAVDKAKEAADAGRRTHTLGQVVHNEGVIHDLESRGVRPIASLDEAEAGATVVIRAHGVTPAVRADASARQLDVVDGTCSWVIAEQKRLAELVHEGYTIVLLGTRNHPEVVGLLGFAPDAIVVDDEEEWERIPRRRRMALITQSTQPPWKFERLAALMTSRAYELKIVNTICPVTIRRQEDTVEAARAVDFMVVVGGRHSANTRELTRLCQIVGTPVLQVESATDLGDPAVFGDAETVGVTGGTSTPIEDLRAVAARVLEIAGTPESAARARTLADAALEEAATAAGRTTSLPAAAH
jgi:4-hydroxy-3-methylbut-2-enyl diphosphate reductase